MSDLYQEVIIEEYQHPQNYGTLNKADVTVHERNASCGDEITVYVKFDAAKKRITDIKWQGTGCAISTAAMSLLSQRILNMEIDNVVRIHKTEMEKLLGMNNVSYGREKCLLLGLQAVKKAVKQ